MPPAALFATTMGSHYHSIYSLKDKKMDAGWMSHVRVPLELLNDAESYLGIISDVSRHPVDQPAPNSREVRSI